MLHLHSAQIWELLAFSNVLAAQTSLACIQGSPCLQFWVALGESKRKSAEIQLIQNPPLKASSKDSAPVASSPCGCLSLACKMTKLSLTFFRSFSLLVKQFSLILQYYSCLLKQHLCLNCRILSSVFSKLFYLCSWPWHGDTQLFSVSENVRDPGGADRVVSGCRSGKMTDEI